jgi:hypothetical protein
VQNLRIIAKSPVDDREKEDGTGDTARYKFSDPVFQSGRVGSAAEEIVVDSRNELFVVVFVRVTLFRFRLIEKALGDLFERKTLIHPVL